MSSKALMLTNRNGLYKVFSTQSVLNLLHCGYCNKPYKDPRLLNCGHTYCLHCLHQIYRYSTIRCIKCNHLQTLTSPAIDHLPKNLFISEMQNVPTVEIDRGAIYKDTFKSLEDLKAKLSEFSEKLEQSEEKLISMCESRKREISTHVDKLIERFRQLEDDLLGEIDDFKNGRLTVLRSAPPEFKETNSNLLQFVNESIDEMMRTDIREDEIKEIYNRCEEHKRLWNETDIIFNSNYATGEISFQMNTNLPKKEHLGTIVEKFPQKSIAQRTSKGPISISECCLNGEYLLLENTSKRCDVNMSNWQITHCIDSVRKITFKFPENFCIKSKQCVKLWAKNKDNLMHVCDDDLVVNNIDNWIHGAYKDICIRVENEFGEEKASFRKPL